MATAGEDAAKLWEEVERLERELAACEAQIREAEKKMAREAQARAAAAASSVLPQLLAEAAGGSGVVRAISGNAATLQQLAGPLRKALAAPAVLVADDGARLHLLAISPEKCQTALPANKLLAEVAAMLGGKGGGRADLAQGSAPRGGDVAAALEKVRELINRSL